MLLFVASHMRSLLLRKNPAGSPGGVICESREKVPVQATFFREKPSIEPRPVSISHTAAGTGTAAVTPRL